MPSVDFQKPRPAASPGLEVLAERVRVARTARQITRAELARRMAMTHATVWRLETGQHAPLPTTVTKVSEALDVPVGWLLDPREVVPRCG